MADDRLNWFDWPSVIGHRSCSVQITQPPGMPEEPYRIIFSIREDLVAILYVYHNSRKTLEP
jgi:hypothetical protein